MLLLAQKFAAFFVAYVSCDRSATFHMLSELLNSFQVGAFGVEPGELLDMMAGMRVSLETKVQPDP